MQKTAKVAAAQIAPVYLDLEASVSKACDTIRTAGETRVDLIVDSCGHYSRPDVVSLQLDSRKKRPLQVMRDPDPGAGQARMPVIRER